MLEYILYGLGFFGVTLLLQYALYKLRKGHNKTKISIWTGAEAAVVICIIGLIQGRVVFLAAVIGFIIADEFGKTVGWHS